MRYWNGGNADDCIVGVIYSQPTYEVLKFGCQPRINWYISPFPAYLWGIEMDTLLTQLFMDIDYSQPTYEVLK